MQQSTPADGHGIRTVTGSRQRFSLQVQRLGHERPRSHPREPSRSAAIRHVVSGESSESR
jgi:hypothetical protein